MQNYRLKNWFPKLKMKTDEIEIFNLNVGVSEILCDIHSIAFQNQGGDEWTADAFQQMLSVNGTDCYIIKHDFTPIGFGLIRKVIDEAEIITFCILPNECNNGYATLLLEWIIKDLQRQSIKRLFLEVSENNKAALGLYKKCSFDIIGRRKGYYQNPQGKNADAIIMQRELVDKI